MAVQYIPQFIPTNTQALQGVLSEYQRAYDANLERELAIQDQYSAIPTLNAADTARKNEILGSFSNTLSDIEKKHNYDRSSTAYSKELARKISELRKNDFWTYNEMKKQKYDMQEKAKAQMGQWYYSPVDVMNATYEDQSALNNWKPYNKQDVAAIAQGLGKEHAEGLKKPIYKEILDPRTKQPILLMIGEQYGFEDTASMDKFLSADGQALVDKAILGAGFGEEALKDPSIRAIATEGLRSTLIGDKKQYMVDLPNLTKKGGDGNPLSASPGIKFTTKDDIVNMGPTQAAKSLYKGAIEPYSQVEKEAIKNSIFSVNPLTSFGQKVYGDLLVNIATSLVPKRNKNSVDAISNAYLFAEAITPNNKAEENVVNNGINIAKEISDAYGLSSDIMPAEVFQKAVVYSMTGGDKNAVAKAVEEVTGKPLTKENRDLARKWNTWWDNSGNMLKDKYRDQLKNREQTWVNKTYSWDTSSADQNNFTGWVANTMKFGKPFFVGTKEMDGSTKDYVSNEHMDYFNQDKLTTFLSKDGKYKFDYNSSGDDAPFMTITNPDGDRVNFQIPIDRFENPIDVATMSGELNDIGFGNDLTLSRFNMKTGEIVSSADSNMKLSLLNNFEYIALLNGKQITPEMYNRVLELPDEFMSKYDVRKKAGSRYEVRKKGSNEWFAELTKEQLFKSMLDSSVLNQ